MCTWMYIHYHHNHTCPQPIDIVVHYDYYCPGSTIDSSTGVKYPCPFPTQSESSAGFDYNDPCAAGNCFLSTECPSGECRLAQLGGRWACCLCGGCGNTSNWCQQRMRASPDTFCYHVCCEGCWADPGGSNSASSATGLGASGRKGRR